MRISTRWRVLWLALALAAYLLLAGYQLGLPGLHYDEAKEAGVNAVELLHGAPLSAFRDATVTIFGRQLPLMVQDYIGALNVYLAAPLLALTGIGVPNLRILALLTGLLAMIMLERAVSAWMVYSSTTMHDSPAMPDRPAPISLAGLLAVTLLAASPSFVFWSRQGVFVTNLTQPFVFLCIWQGIRWLQVGRLRSLLIAASAAGFALYAKLLAIWIVGPFAALMLAWWFWLRRQPAKAAPPLPATHVLAAGALFVLPLLPFLLFNWQTSGTLQSIAGNLSQSYYGVNNLALLQNLVLRAQQLMQTLCGDHLWYLGAVYSNPSTPWLALGALVAGLWRKPAVVAPPLVLLGAAICLSVFTVSGLFITHQALMQPLAIAVVGVAIGVWEKRDGALRKSAAYALATFLAIWLAFDLVATVGYHRALSRSGGLADHSDASYHLTYYLRYNGMGAPIALDWGLDATVRFLSEGAVTPIEIFGYASLAAPDDGFAARLEQFLGNPANVYLLHAPQHEVFAGRRARFLERVSAAGLRPILEQQFTQRDGSALVEVWRVVP